MSAKPLQQISTSADALMQVKALDTASAALALALFVHRNHDHRAGRCAPPNGGHDADDAGVPVPAPKQDHTIFHAAGVLVQLLQSSFQDLLFRLLPGGVDLPQLAGQLCSPVLILTQHQLQSGNSAVHAARRIDPGGQCIADILGCKGFACKAGLLQQRLNARAGRSGSADADPP